SVWQTPQAVTRMRISPLPGTGQSRFTSFKGRSPRPRWDTILLSTMALIDSPPPATAASLLRIGLTADGTFFSGNFWWMGVLSLRVYQRDQRKDRRTSRSAGNARIGFSLSGVWVADCGDRRRFCCAVLGIHPNRERTDSDRG